MIGIYKGKTKRKEENVNTLRQPFLMEISKAKYNYDRVTMQLEKHLWVDGSTDCQAFREHIKKCYCYHIYHRISSFSKPLPKTL